MQNGCCLTSFPASAGHVFNPLLRRKKQSCSCYAGALIWFVINWLSAVGIVHAGIGLDFLMDSDPEFRVPEPIKSFPKNIKELWIAALARPEIDLQRMAGASIARAHKLGMPGLIEAVPSLEKIVQSDSSQAASRFVAARALIVLESAGSADKLFKASQQFGSDLRQLVEPALAQWDFAPARAIWMDRLQAPETHPRELLLAVRGLGQVREIAALPAILKIAKDLVRSAEVRLEAATAAGQLAETGLEQDADQLSHETRTPRMINRLCSIRLLSRHESVTTRRLLLEFAEDVEPAVIAAALNRLNQIDSALVLPVAESAMKHTNSDVREQGVTAYLSLPIIERIQPLSHVLNDPHPNLRRRVRECLFHLAEKPELNMPIRDAAMEILAGDRWQGQEHASLLLAELNHQQAAARLLELLESQRPEVMVASAWALRKLAMRDTIPGIIDKAVRQTALRKIRTQPGIDDQVAHLLEACGSMNVTVSTSLLNQYIPMGTAMGVRSRCAAIWALGKINEGTPNQTLADALIDRIIDQLPRPSDSWVVKTQCVIALARIKAVDKAPLLRSFLENGTDPSPFSMATKWAMKELTGEVFPEPQARILHQGDWFLEPLP